jgi:hypothetical protein
MPNRQEPKRKRMVVEEIGVSETTVVEDEKVKEIAEPKILEKAAKDTASLESETMTEKKEPDEVKESKIIKPKKSSSIALWIIIPGIFLLGAILGGIVFYQRGVNRGQVETPSATVSPTTSPIVSPSPAATIDLSKYTISVFNGSGIVGEAVKAKTLLTTAGFKVGSTANAATYDYTKTIIKAKSTVEAPFISALSSALGKNYSVDTSQTLASTSADTVQVVVGSSKAQ